MNTKEQTVTINICKPMRFQPFGWKNPDWMLRLPKGKQECMWAAVYILNGKAVAAKSQFEFRDKEAAQSAAGDMRKLAETEGYTVVAMRDFN